MSRVTLCVWVCGCEERGVCGCVGGGCVCVYVCVCVWVGGCVRVCGGGGGGCVCVFEGGGERRYELF